MNPTQSLYIRAAKCEKTERFPIWIMRQAGRYMSSYQQMRKKYSFMEMVKTPEIGAEVTLQPVHAFGMDAAILFSDILVLPDAWGMGLEFIDKQGPVFANSIQSQWDVDQLDLHHLLERLDYVMQEIAIVKRALQGKGTPLIGFAGAPFTVASYMVGSGKGHNLGEFMKIAFSQPAMIHSLLDKLAEATAIYLNGQIQAGIDAIQLFDSWSNVLSWDFFKELSLPYIKKVLERLHNPRKIPVTLFGLANSVFYPLLQDIGVDAIGFDSHVEMQAMRRAVLPTIAVQGNLDPHLLYASEPVLRAGVMKILESMRGADGFIFNLSHGVFPDVQEERVKFVVDLVKEFSPLQAKE